MEITILTQLSTFGVSLIFGVILGLIFSLFRIFDNVLAPTTKRLFLEDVFYFFIIGVLSFIFILVINKGNFRIFIVIGESSGFFIWHFTLGHLLVKFSNKFLFAIKERLEKVKIKVLQPVNFLSLKVKKRLYALCQKS